MNALIGVVYSMELKELQSLKIEVVDSLGNLVLIKGMFYLLNEQENEHKFIGILKGSRKPFELNVRFIDQDHKTILLSGHLQVPKHWFVPTRIPVQLSEPMRKYCVQKKKELLTAKRMEELKIKNKEAEENLGNAILSNFSEEKTQTQYENDEQDMKKYASLIQDFVRKHSLNYMIGYSEKDQEVYINFKKPFWLFDLKDCSGTLYEVEKSLGDYILVYEGDSKLQEYIHARKVLNQNMHIWKEMNPTISKNYQYQLIIESSDVKNQGIFDFNIILTRKSCTENEWKKLKTWLLDMDDFSLTD